MYKKTIAAIDIGTRNVRALCGDVYRDKLELRGHVSSRSFGVRNGSVVDLDALQSCLSSVLKELYAVSKVKPSSIYMNISSQQIQSLNSNGIAAIKDGVVGPTDIAKAMDTAQTKALPHDLVLMHSFPQEYEIDGQGGILQPLNMRGNRLDVRAHIVVGPKIHYSNLQSVISRLGVNLESLVFSPIAPAFSTLTDDEKEIGVMCIDMGAGTTDVVIYRDNTIQESFSINFGGDDINRAISSAFSVTSKKAEQLKIEKGCAFLNCTDNETFKIERKNYSTTSEFLLKELHLLIATVLNDFIDKRLKERIEPRLRTLIKGIVLTGGGSNLAGLETVLSKSFNTSTRIGTPLEINESDRSEEWSVLSSPEYSMVSGIYMFGARYCPAPTKINQLKSKIASFMGDYF